MQNEKPSVGIEADWETYETFRRRLDAELEVARRFIPGAASLVVAIDEALLPIEHLESFINRHISSLTPAEQDAAKDGVARAVDGVVALTALLRTHREQATKGTA